LNKARVFYSPKLIILSVNTTRKAKICLIAHYQILPKIDDDEVEEFYQPIKDVMKATKKYEIIIIMGDWNAKEGRETTENVTGHRDLGIRNDRGKRLIQFRKKNS